MTFLIIASWECLVYSLACMFFVGKGCISQIIVTLMSDVMLDAHTTYEMSGFKWDNVEKNKMEMTIA